MPFSCAELELDPAAVRRRAERVREQVVDDLQHAVAVGDDHRPGADVDAVVDRARAGLLAERLVGLLDELLHVDLLAQHGEAVGVELREVEDVADEPLEPPRLGLDDLERARPQLGILDERPRAAPRRGRGSPSAASAARARPTSGSCARAPRPLRAAAAISSKRSARWPISPGRALAALDLVVAARDLVGGARQREDGPHDPAREVPGERAGDEQAERPGDREPAHERAARCWLTSVFCFATTIAPIGVLPIVDAAGRRRSRSRAGPAA